MSEAVARPVIQGRTRDWDEILRAVPVVTDRLVLDMVDGLEVSAHSVRVRSAQVSPLVRIAKHVTGPLILRQEGGDSPLVTQIEAVNNWILQLRKQHVDTERALTKVAQKLQIALKSIKVLAGTQQVSGAHVTDPAEVRELKEAIERLEGQLNATIAGYRASHQQLEEQIRQQGERTSASFHLETVLAGWDAGRLDAFPFVVQISLVLETLFWGAFGRYYRQSPELGERLREECIGRYLKREGVRRQQLMVAAEWLYPVREGNEAQRQLVSYLFTGATDVEPWIPLSRAMSEVASAPALGDELEDWFFPRRPTKLPHVLTPERLCGRMVQEVHLRLTD